MTKNAVQFNSIDTSRQPMDRISTHGERARKTAFALTTINHATPEKDSNVAGVANKLCSIDAMCRLLQDFALEGHSSSENNLPLYRNPVLESALNCLEACSSVLTKIESLALDTDRWLSSKQEKSAPTNSLSTTDEDWSALTTCLLDLCAVVSAARVGQLQKITSKEPTEKRELCRLEKAMNHPRLKNSLLHDKTPIYASAPLPYAEPRQPNSTASPSTVPCEQATLELHHPRGFRGRYGHPDYPFPFKKAEVYLEPPDAGLHFDKSFEESEIERYKLSLEGRYPNIAAFGIWPPVGIEKNSIQDRQIQSIMAGGDRSPTPASSTGNAPLNTPASTRDNSPAVPKVNVTTPSGTSFAHPNRSTTGSQTASGSLFGGATNLPAATGHQATGTQPPTSQIFFPSLGPVEQSFVTKANPSSLKNEKPKELEAYMLSPQCEDIHGVVEWSHKIELLPLDKDQIEAHLRNLGANYSVVNSITMLESGQWKPISVQTKNRRGTLISLEKAQGVSMWTKFGTFKMQSVIFIIQTTDPFIPDSEVNCTRFGNVQGRTSGLFGQPRPGGLFGQAPFGQANTGGLFNQQPAGFGQGSTGGPFNQQPAAFGQGQAGGLFGQAPNVGPFGRSPIAGTAAAPYNGFTETDGWGTHHYQSITFLPPYRNQSFEELRVADYAANRKGFGTANGSGDGIFGASANNKNEIKGTQPQPFNTGCSGAHLRNNPGSGLFGGQPQTQPNAPLSIFANPTPSLFGANAPFQPPATRPGSLFGDAEPAQGSQNASSSNSFGKDPIHPQDHPLSSGFGKNLSTTTSGSPFSFPKAETRQGLSNFPPRPSPLPTSSPSILGHPMTATGSGGLFGPSSTGPTTSTSLFGNTQNSNQPTSNLGDGTNIPIPGTSLFGVSGTNTQPTNSLFGGAIPARPAPAIPPLFGGLGTGNGATSSTARSLFGGLGDAIANKPAPSLFGGFGTGNFNSTSSAPSLFAGLGSQTSGNNTASSMHDNSAPSKTFANLFSNWNSANIAASGNATAASSSNDGHFPNLAKPNVTKSGQNAASCSTENEARIKASSTSASKTEDTKLEDAKSNLGASSSKVGGEKDILSDEKGGVKVKTENDDCNGKMRESQAKAEGGADKKDAQNKDEGKTDEASNNGQNGLGREADWETEED